MTAFVLFFTSVLLMLLNAYVDGEVYGYTVESSHYDCTHQADGVIEIGCDGWLECRNGQQVKNLCNENTEVFDRNTMSCRNIVDGAQPGCTHVSWCAQRPDGNYADLDSNCQTYFTCYRGVFYGHTYCPAGLVFHQQYQICDWSYNTPRPCGTKIV